MYSSQFKMHFEWRLLCSILCIVYFTATRYSTMCCLVRKVLQYDQYLHTRKWSKLEDNECPVPLFTVSMSPKTKTRTCSTELFIDQQSIGLLLYRWIIITVQGADPGTSRNVARARPRRIPLLLREGAVLTRFVILKTAIIFTKFWDKFLC